MIIRDINFENALEVHKVATLYVKVPENWETNFEYSDREIQETVEWLLRRRDALKCLVAEELSQIVAIHILQTSEKPEECIIRTLWVEPTFRKNGLASKMKREGERWAAQRGAKRIVTNVSVENAAMLEMNKKAGYLPVKIRMEKRL